MASLSHARFFRSIGDIGRWKECEVCHIGRHFYTTLPQQRPTDVSLQNCKTADTLLSLNLIHSGFHHKCQSDP